MDITLTIRVELPGTAIDDQSSPTIHTYTIPLPSQPIKSEKLIGKAKDVFSKKQIFLLFDLLSQDGKSDKLNLNITHMQEGIAKCLHAFTGKSTASLLQAMKDFREKDLYTYHTEGEFRQLISTLTNLEKILREGCLKSWARLCEKKINSLEQAYNRGLQ